MIQFNVLINLIEFNFLSIFTTALQKENNIFAYLDNRSISNINLHTILYLDKYYILNLNTSLVKQVFLNSYNSFLKGQVPLFSEQENLIYPERVRSEYVLKVISDSLNLINHNMLKEHNLNLALSKAPEISSANANVGKDWDWKWIAGITFTCIAAIAAAIAYFKGKGSSTGSSTGPFKGSSTGPSTGSSSNLGQQSLTDVVDLTKRVENKIQSLELPTNIGGPLFDSVDTGVDVKVAENAALTTRCDTLEADVAAKIVENAELITRCDTLEANIAAKIDENAALTTRCDTLEADVAAKIDENAALTTRCDTLEANIAAKIAENAALTTRCDTLRQIGLEQNAEIGRLAAQLPELYERLDTASTTLLTTDGYVRSTFGILRGLARRRPTAAEIERIQQIVDDYNAEIIPNMMELQNFIATLPPLQ